MIRVGRRAVLAGGAAWLAAPRAACAAPAEPLEAILAGSKLGPVTGFALADLDGGLIETHRADAPLPPASVAKVVTTLYALDALGPGFRFRTEIRPAGPVEAGVLKGDLVLAGGGDPVLDTDALGDMGGALRAVGVGAVGGRFLVATGALPAVAEIDAGQPEDAPYNPTISGMNLNFNRVFLAWAPGKQGPAPGVERSRRAFRGSGERHSCRAGGGGSAAAPLRRRGRGLEPAAPGLPGAGQRLAAGAGAGGECRRGLPPVGRRARAWRCRRPRWSRRRPAR